MLTLFARQLSRELQIALRQPRLLINALLFFIVLMVFFPLAMPPTSQWLKQFAPGLLWMALLLSMLLATERFFQQDYEDGVIEQWLLSGSSVSVIVMAKMIAQWMLISLPIVVVSPLLLLLFDFNPQNLLILLLGLLIGSPALLALCAFAAALSTTLPQRGMLMALILLPLAIPIVIFGSGLLRTTLTSAICGQLALLGALSLLTMGLLPFAIAGIIRISLND